MTSAMTENRTPTSSSGDRRSRGILKRAVTAIGTQNLSLIIAWLLLVALIAALTDKFFLPQNLLNIGQAVSVVGLVAVGVTIVIISGGLDISVGAIAGVAGVVAAIAVNGSGAAAGVVAGLLAGLVLGLVNGLIINVLRVNAVIATLATLSAFRGLAFLIAPDGKPVGAFNPAFAWLGQGTVPLGPGIPVSLLVFLAVAAIGHVLMRFTTLGRQIYAVGGNQRAARLAGIRVTRLRYFVYATSGAVAAMAGIVLSARTFSGSPDGGAGLELEAITAAFLGGCALEGGKGSIPGTLLAVLLIGTLSNGMSLLGIPTFYQLVAKGTLLILAVAISQWRLARAERGQV